jgi:hypothetical protein
MPSHVLVTLLALVAACVPYGLNAAPVNGDDIVAHCSNKYQGDDQQSKLTVTFVNSGGKVEKTGFTRLWKRYSGTDDLQEKVIIITEFPADKKDIRFMRWGYTLQSGKGAEQWIYIPQLRKVRRVSPRPADDLQWGFIDEDLSEHDPAADTHRLLGVDTINGRPFYLVESRPKEYQSQYSKWLTWYPKTASWDQCAPVELHYYGHDGLLIKRVGIAWQKLGKAWLWKKAIVQDVKAARTISYEVTDVKVNVGLSDHLFNERTLRMGYNH